MYRHDMKYIEARRIVRESRRCLRMSDIDPTTLALQEECERIIGSKNESRNKSSATVVPSFRSSFPSDTIAEVEHAPWRSDLLKKSVVYERAQSARKHFTTTKSGQEVVCNIVALMNGVVTANELIEKECKATITKEIIHEDSTTSKRDYFEITETKFSGEEAELLLSLDDELFFVEADRDERTEAEQLADDASQTTYNSKCFTTAKELGIDVDEVYMDENEELDIVHETEIEQPLLDKVPSASDNLKTRDDHQTTSTSSESDEGIPTVIYIRTDLPPAVPDNEPLAQCYNLALPVFTRRQRLRGALVNSWRRLTGFKKRPKTRLTDDCTEVRNVTLVDL